MVGCYDLFMGPLERYSGLAECRRHLIPRARGRVLELGPGTGANGRWYDPAQATSLELAGPEPHPSGKLLERCRMRGLPVSYRSADVQELPYADGSFDTVVATLLFCSVEDPARGLKELRRVLRPGGEYLFIEHVRPKDAPYGRIADLATPLWRRIAGGCRLNRETEAGIRAAGFTVVHDCEYAVGIFVGGVAV